MLLTTRVLDFHGNMFSIKDDETPDQVLRRSKDSIFYIETVRIFEEAFGIRELEKGLQEVKEKWRKKKEQKEEQVLKEEQEKK